MSMLPEKPGEMPPAKRGISTVGALLIGCGVIGLLGVITCAGVGIFAVRWGMGQVNKIADEFVAQGYERQTGQVFEISQSPQKKTVYVCQLLQIRKDVDVDIAVVSQMCEIHADVHGNVDFFGQVLKVDSGVVIDGDLRVKQGQMIEINGEVKGKITGSYMVLNYKGKTYQSGETPPAADHDASQDHSQPNDNAAPRKDTAPKDDAAPKDTAPKDDAAPKEPGSEK